MSNRIRRVEVRERSLDPAQAELWVCVHPERQSATTEVHGRLLGPRCPYATTVEVAYPLRPFARTPEGLAGVVRRVVIPEASLWEPESPFLYEGPVELWEDGQAVDRVQLSRGLRSFQFSLPGLRVNGRRLPLRGRAAESLAEAQARDFRAEGTNLLVVPTRPETAPVWAAADHWGFLVLGLLANEPESLSLASVLADHASSLGWVLEQRDLPTLATWLQGQPQLRVGVHLTEDVNEPLPAGIRFLVQDDAGLLRLGDAPLPVILRRTGGATRSEDEPGIAAQLGVIGWIDA